MCVDACACVGHEMSFHFKVFKQKLNSFVFSQRQQIEWFNVRFWYICLFKKEHTCKLYIVHSSITFHLATNE